MRQYKLREEKEYEEYRPCECGHYEHDHVTTINWRFFRHGSSIMSGKCRDCMCPNFTLADYYDWMNQIIIDKSRGSETHDL